MDIKEKLAVKPTVRKRDEKQNHKLYPLTILRLCGIKIPSQKTLRDSIVIKGKKIGKKQYKA